MQLVDNIDSDGSFVGVQPQRAASPRPAAARSTSSTPKKRASFIVTGSAPIGSDGNQGNSTNGLFGQVIVEPAGARIYRSQVHEEELRLVADINRNGMLDAAEKTTLGQPKIANSCSAVAGAQAGCYEATYPGTAPWTSEGKARPADPQHDEVRQRQRLRDRALRDQRDRRRPERRRQLPRVDLSAGEQGQAQPDAAQPARAVPRFRLGVSRRSRPPRKHSRASSTRTRSSTTCSPACATPS